MSLDRDGFVMPEQSHICSNESSATYDDRSPGTSRPQNRQKTCWMGSFM